MRSRDTSRRSHEAQRSAQRALGPQARVDLAIEMSEQAREISVRGVLARTPGVSEAQARETILRRILGDDLFAEAWAAKSRT